MQISSSPTGRVWKRERGTKVASSGCDGRKHEPSRSLQTILIHTVTEDTTASAAAVTIFSHVTVVNFTV
jgi:hypothetical protein